MGPGRARATASTVLVGMVALLFGCGESRHGNDQRPQGSTRVSVTISQREVIVQPTRVAFGPEPHQEIPQNQDHPEPPLKGKSKTPLGVTFVVANQTAQDATVQVLDQSRLLKGSKVYARSPGTFGVELPAGSYTISAAGMPGARPAHLTVGRYRASSQNDVLLP
jgi:hypothetical protein